MYTHKYYNKAPCRALSKGFAVNVAINVCKTYERRNYAGLDVSERQNGLFIIHRIIVINAR